MITDYFKGPLVLISRLILGSVFIYASFDKIVNPGDFAKIVGNYHVLPFGIENLLAIILPWVEFIAGVCLIVGVMVDGATILVILMNIVFIFAITQALARGISVECGCVSVASDTGSAIGVKTILRDIGYLFLAYIVYYRKDHKVEYFPKSV